MSTNNVCRRHKHILLSKKYKTSNPELKQIHTWFNANKLSINLTETIYSYFPFILLQRSIPFHFARLEINNKIIKREPVMKFLDVLLDENLNWKDHVHCLETKILEKHGNVIQSWTCTK